MRFGAGAQADGVTGHQQRQGHGASQPFHAPVGTATHLGQKHTHRG
jgi:hypothetical protein